jgi:hypothetical protein
MYLLSTRNTKEEVWKAITCRDANGQNAMSKSPMAVAPTSEGGKPKNHTTTYLTDLERDSRRLTENQTGGGNSTKSRLSHVRSYRFLCRFPHTNYNGPGRRSIVGGWISQRRALPTQTRHQDRLSLRVSRTETGMKL